MSKQSDPLPIRLDDPPANAKQWLEELYNNCGKAAYALAINIVKCRHLAEDATHNAFLKAWTKRKQLRNKHAVRTWFYAIVKNEAFKLYDQKKKKQDRYLYCAR